jgi:hypothetical protein
VHGAAFLAHRGGGSKEKGNQADTSLRLRLPAADWLRVCDGFVAQTEDEMLAADESADKSDHESDNTAAD